MGASARWRALGCDVDLVVTDPAALDEGRLRLAEDLSALDLAASRFRADSEVVGLADANGERRGISPLLADLLDVALQAAERTAGDLDPTVGADLVALGYDRDLAAVTPADRYVGRGPQSGPTALAQARVGRTVRWTDVELDRVAGTVRVPAGTVLDLGATAKAHTADLSADRLARALGCGVLVGLGGDVAVAGLPPEGGWVIRVQDVTGDPGCAVPVGASTCTVGLRAGGLATSSTAARRWRHAGSVVHHILDPRTGRSASAPWRTVSVAAPSCREANIASTTAVIRGRSAVGWLEALGVPARLVPTALGRAPMLLGGWPAATEVA